MELLSPLPVPDIDNNDHVMFLGVITVLLGISYSSLYTYSLCFTFAQCTKPASLVPLVFYADQAAYRGRLYQEAIVDRHFQSSSSAQSVKAAFDKSLYKLCPNLENSMFFICFCWTTFFFVFVVAGVVSLKCHFVGIM